MRAELDAFTAPRTNRVQVTRCGWCRPVSDVNTARAIHDYRRERERAQARQAFLPFGDGFLDDDRPDFHGTNVGLQRHTDAGEEFCPPCRELVDELLALGLAQRLTPEPEEN
jgi:hypothetical protein